MSKVIALYLVNEPKSQIDFLEADRPIFSLFRILVTLCLASLAKNIRIQAHSSLLGTFAEAQTLDFVKRVRPRHGIFCLRLSIAKVNTNPKTGLAEKRQKAVAAKDSRDHKQAHKLLLDFFPNIPETNCSEILQHGFQKGSGRVGRSQILEDKLKVHLAVNAHIRHRLTQYDSILATNKEQDAKPAAREMVYNQVQAIADSWRASRPSRTLRSSGSATILEDNRQRRNRRSEAQIKSADEAQILETALGGLQLNENEREAWTHAEGAQRLAQKKAQKVARRNRSARTTLNLLHQYERDPSIKLSKKEKKEVLRLQKEPKKTTRKRGYLQPVPTGQNANLIKPVERERNRKLRITTNGVELEPREVDRHDDGESRGTIEGPTSEDRSMVEDSEWMDIEEISSRAAGVHLA